ncbi:hypothetical protein, partial [Geobacillus stearothermophilus]|uniref:hypothetical protein n=1 Tax=Geobacillus stearothermophilus TaxID=1422 RepID=UPI002E217FCA|nr:hypothetical protein [Geobacillus stearothermophilus]
SIFEAKKWGLIPKRIRVLGQPQASVWLASVSRKWANHFSVKDMLNFFVASILKIPELQNV